MRIWLNVLLFIKRRKKNIASVCYNSNLNGRCWRIRDQTETIKM